jgi:hypothetical protein
MRMTTSGAKVIARQQDLDAGQDSIGGRHAQCSANRGTQQRLSQQLAHNSPSLSAQGAADCQFMVASSSPCQQQDGHVPAANRQQEGDRPKEEI